jgi:hypothetical protein
MVFNQSIFKEIVIHVRVTQHACICFKFLAIEEKIIKLSKTHRNACQPLYATKMGKLIKTLIQNENLDYLTMTIKKIKGFFTLDKQFCVNQLGLEF